MAFIIIDLEFNNLSGIHKCIPNVYNDNPGLKNLELDNEIIEIGAVKLDAHMQPCEELKVYIKPSVIPIINPKILEITKINIKDLENGVGFVEGINKLKEMVDEGDIICSWAKDDIAEIIRNANYYGYTAHVFKNVYNARAIKKYIIEDVYKMPALEVRSLEGVELNYEKINQICPKCQKKLEIDYPFSIVGWRFISLGTCSKCNSRVLDELIVKKSLCGEEIYKEVATVIDEYDYLRYENKLKNKVYN